MKKILILVDKIDSQKEYLREYLEKEFQGKAGVTLGRFSDLSFLIEDNKISGWLKGEDLKNFQLVIIRRVPGGWVSVARTLAMAMELWKIKYFDSAYGRAGVPRGKLFCSAKLALMGLPIMPSFFCGSETISRNKRFIIQHFNYPFVAKEIYLQRGKGVFLIRNEKELLKLKNCFPEGQFLFQKYFPSDEEYRLLVLKDQVAVWERKTRTSKKEFRQNVALGAKEEFLPLEKLPEEMKVIALKSAKVLGLEIAGIDLLVEKNKKKIWLLEVNFGPGFTYDVNLSPEISQLASFFAREMGIKK